MSRAFIVGFVVGVALLVVGAVAGSRLRQTDVQKAAEEREYRVEIVDATPVQPGIFTERQRVHSALHARYGGLSHFRISALAAQFRSGSRIFGTVISVPWEPILTGVGSAEDYFGEMARASDAVISGRAIKKESQITDDDAFIFSDYSVLITEVLKDNAASSLNTDTTIVVTRPGGKVLVDGVIAKATDRLYDPLPLDKSVVLFLRFIPETGAYKATRATGSFELDGSTVKALTGGQVPQGVLRDRDSFLRTIRTVSNNTNSR